MQIPRTPQSGRTQTHVNCHTVDYCHTGVIFYGGRFREQY